MQSGSPTALVLLIGLCGLPATVAQVTAQEPSTALEAVRIDVPIRVDGRLDEAIWSQVPYASGFVQKEPIEGAPAVNDTRVWVLYDDEALYVGAIMFDDEPERIAQDLARRDSQYQGRADYFEILLDTNLDQRTGYRFRTTAADVQTDRYLYDDGEEDAAWDAVWASEVTITDQGWVAEFRIPLSQVRYETSSESQSWGVNFGRRRAADNELTRLVLESKLRPGRVSQFGRMGGLLLPTAPARVEVRPYILSSLHRGPSEDADPYFDGSSVTGRAGVDLRYGIGTSFTLDATFNPDFGQVELDPAVINLTAFETFLDERRPFFVEDARVFDFSLSGGRNSLFYSRRLGRSPTGRPPSGADFFDTPANTSILGAAKLTGRTPSGLSVGALAAVTAEETGRAFDLESGSETEYFAEPRTAYGVLRLQQDLRESQTAVGGIVTMLDRAPAPNTFRELTSSAFNGGIDFEHTWGNREWALWGFLAASHVRGSQEALQRIQLAPNHYRQRPDINWSSLDSTATSMTGSEWRLQFERRSGAWTGAVWAAQVTSGFEINDFGFSQTPERLDGGMRVGYQNVTPGDLFRFYSVSVFTFHNWSHEALRDTWSWPSWGNAHTAGRVALNGNGQLTNFWRVNGSIGYRPETMSRTLTRGGPRMVAPGEVSVNVGFQTDNRARIHLSPRVDLAWGGKDNGTNKVFGLEITAQPSPKLQLSLEPRYQRYSTGSQYVTSTSALAYEPTFGRRYVFADLERTSLSMLTRLNWTFTTDLSLELFAQPLLASGDYVTYKQLLESESFAFDEFSEGTHLGDACITGRTCLNESGTRFVDFDQDGQSDLSFSDRDFNIRSLRANAVLRWEYIPGSTIFFVWQRRQSDQARVGNFDFSRDLSALFDATADNVFILKANIWISR